MAITIKQIVVKAISITLDGKEVDGITVSMGKALMMEDTILHPGTIQITVSGRFLIDCQLKGVEMSRELDIVEITTNDMHGILV